MAKQRNFYSILLFWRAPSFVYVAKKTTRKKLILQSKPNTLEKKHLALPNSVCEEPQNLFLVQFSKKRVWSLEVWPDYTQNAKQTFLKDGQIGYKIITYGLKVRYSSHEEDLRLFFAKFSPKLLFPVWPEFCRKYPNKNGRKGSKSFLSKQNKCKWHFCQTYVNSY